MTDAPASSLGHQAGGTWVIAVGAGAAAAGAYGFQVLGGRTLGAEGFAPVAALWTMGYLIHGVLMIPVEQVIARTLAISGGRRVRSALPGSALSTLLLGVAVGSALVAATLARFYENEWGFVAVMLLMMSTRAVMTAGRGVLAGERRFTSYGVSLVGEAAVLALLGALAALMGGGALTFGTAMALAPLTILAVRPFRAQGIGVSTETRARLVPHRPALLGFLLIATALAQIVLAGGPLVVELIGGSAAAVSVFFVTFTLFRGPVTASYGLATRWLTESAGLVAAGAVDRLHIWSRRIAAVGASGTIVLSLVGYFAAPGVIEFLYGSEFRPTAMVAGLGAAGVAAGLAVLFSSQVLIALGAARDLVVGWAFGLLLATTVVSLSSGDAVLRVAAAFFAGETTAFVFISSAALRRTRVAVSAPGKLAR